MASDTFRRIDALLAVALRLARTAPSGRIALARIADSVDPGWIPLPWGEELVAALTNAAASGREPLEHKQVERILRDAWGSRPAEVLDELDPDPVAVTPISQVHRGMLDGGPVAVKVRHPGLATSVRQDLTVLEALLGPLDAAFPALDASSVLREFRERVLDELDLEHEATVQRRFHRALRSHPFLVIPAPVTELARESVLVSTWVDGLPLWSAPDPDQAAARLIAFAIGAARAGLVHADLTPQDVLVTADGRLAILDFGATATIDQPRVELLAAAVDAFAEGDEDAFAHALADLGALGPDHAPTAFELARHALSELAGAAPSRLDSDAVNAARDRLLERPRALAELIGAGTLAPQDLWPARGVAQLFATIARVGATGPWLELVRAALRDGWAG